MLLQGPRIFLPAADLCRHDQLSSARAKFRIPSMPCHCGISTSNSHVSVQRSRHAQFDWTTLLRQGPRHLCC
jgi:hypothetical protein